jgi:Leucine-rich repeat (LRR) protein
MPRVTCAGLEHLRQATALEHLSLDGTGVDDRIWPLIARWPKLERLSLADCRIVDPPPDPLRPLPSLKSLVVSFTNMTDAGLLTIAGRCPNLLELGIAQNEKQNLRSLAPLRGFPRLTTVFCSSDQLTQEGVDVLAANTRIDELRVFGPWDDSMFERLAPLRGQLKRFAVQASGLLATAPTSRAYERLAKFSGLADVSLQGEQGSPCDADLDVLARLPRLKTLALAFPETPSDAKSSAAVRRYTPAGIEALRKARPDVRLLIDGNEYAADPEAVAAAGKNIDRRVAEHVLALGGTMQLLYRPHGRYAAQIGDLPSDSFKIANISLPNAQLLHGEHIALIGQLRHPRSLDLTGTPLLNGDLEHIGKLETLRWLRISSTKVTDEGLVALKPLERLTYLNLEGIKVTARGMEAIGELSHLEELLLGNASVSDDGLAQLHGLKRLRSLNLANARITDAGLKHLAGLTDLENLDLTGTRINGSGLGHLATLPRLDTLILTNSAVKDEHVKELPSLAALHEVALAGTRLTDAAVDALSQVKALANIDLGGTLVTEEGRERLGGALTTSNLNRQHVDATRAAATWMLESGGKVNYVKRVAELPAAPFEIFNVNFAWLKTTDDAAIVHLAGLSNLRDLNISGVTITGQVRLLQGAPRLRFLATSNNQQLTDDWFDALAGCALLRVLSLDGTNVSAANFAKLRELLLVNVTLGGATDQILAVLPKARLTHLACGLTPGVSDVGLEHLREATEIELLDLYSNYSVTDAGLQGLKGLRQLRHLNLAGTRLFGEGLEHLSEQKQLELLGLGGTRVDDEHLAALSQLDRLCSLGLAGTEITDAGLEHLKTLDDLDVLYLQQTQVTERGVARLQAALPHCRIVSNFAPETP